jgi:superfamily II DNA/RNA helicase
MRGIKPGLESYAKNLPEIEKAVAGHIDYHMPSKEGYPSTSHQVVTVPMSKEQQKYYATVTSNASPIIAWKVRRNMPLSKAESRDLNAFMTAARIVSNTTAPYGGKEPSPKLARAASDLKEMVTANPKGKALIYSNYLEGGVKEYSKHLDAMGIPHHIFSGELSDKERKIAVNDYNNGKVKALLISGAGSEGLDLKGTRLVQVLEPHWNKARIDQAIGRAVRYKSHTHLPEEERNVHITHYHSGHNPTLLNKIFRTKTDVGADQYLSELSQKKDLLNQQFLDVLKAEGEKVTQEMRKEKTHE